MPLTWKVVLLCGSLAVANRAGIREAVPQQPSTWKDWKCPPLSTVSVNVVEYVPVTTTQVQILTASIFETETISIYETKTQPNTIYQTVIWTEIVTTVESTTETDVVTISTTAIDTTTSPLTLTATEKEELFTSTTQLTSLIICPTRTANPTYTAQGPYPSDWTWGCPIGWLCKPKQENCNFEAGLPDRKFYCAPNECVPAETLPAILPTWDDTIYGNSTGLGVNAIDSFFNMNPTDFGFTYEIFVVNQVFTYTSTILIPPTPTVGARQAQTSIPGACYPWCNNCLLEAQSAGKTPKLCYPDSAFEVSLTQCEECINVHRDDSSGSFVEIAPQFQQFLDYCAQFSTAVISTMAASTATAPQSTYTTLVPTTAVSIVPTESASKYSTLLSTSISESLVSTATLIASPSPPPPPPSSSSLTPVEASSAAPPSSSAPSSSVAASSAPSPSVYTTTATTTLISTASAVTYSGNQVTSLTIIMSVNNTVTTVTGSALNNATVIIPSSVEVVSSYVTTVTLSSSPAVVSAASSSPAPPSPTGAASASASAFAGSAAAGSIPPRDGFSAFAVLLACLMII